MLRIATLWKFKVYYEQEPRKEIGISPILVYISVLVIATQI